MSPNEHNLYWIREFSRRMSRMTQYSPDWYLALKLRAAQIREWRTRNKLTVVNKPK